jgi:hypothetical protein
LLDGFIQVHGASGGCHLDDNMVPLCRGLPLGQLLEPRPVQDLDGAPVGPDVAAGWRSTSARSYVVPGRPGATPDCGNVSNPTVGVSRPGLPAACLGPTLPACTGTSPGGACAPMIIRVAFRLLLLLGSLTMATALVVGALSALASSTLAEATRVLERAHAAAVERAIEAPVDTKQAATSPTPAVALVFAGVVLLAALPPAYRVHSHHRSDWL